MKVARSLMCITAVLALTPVRAQQAPNAADAAGGVAASERDFAKAMNDAMVRMHMDMSVPYTGDPDRDFARMMIPHHQGAIDMAKIQLQYGKDERLRRLAQAIIVEQQQEILVMQEAIGKGEAKAPSHAAKMTHGDHR